jgi:translocator protein
VPCQYFNRKEENFVFSPLKVNGKKNILAFIISIFIAEGVAASCGYFIMKDHHTYESLIKPGFTMPYIVLEIVWPILYFFIAIAAYRIWMRGRGKVSISKAISLYGIQLFLSIMWIIIFFKWRLIGLAFFELMLLLVFILLTTFEFFRIDKAAGFLKIPYILWVSFAGVLNYILWMMNNM